MTNMESRTPWVFDKFSHIDMGMDNEYISLYFWMTFGGLTYVTLFGIVQLSASFEVEEFLLKIIN